MKSLRLVPLPLACLLAAGLLGPTLSRAADDDQAAHKAAAEDVIKAMHLDSLFATTTDRMMTMVDRLSDGAARQITDKTAAADFQTRMRNQSRDLLKKSFNWEAVEPQFIQIYENSFTTEELKNLTAFYSTPLGQKLVAKQPDLSEQMGKASQQRAQQVMPQIINLVRSEAAKLQPASASAPGAPGTLVAPGARIPGPAGAPGPFTVPPPPPPGLGRPPLPPAAPPFAVPPAPPVASPAVTPVPTAAPAAPASAPTP